MSYVYHPPAGIQAQAVTVRHTMHMDQQPPDAQPNHSANPQPPCCRRWRCRRYRRRLRPVSSISHRAAAAILVAVMMLAAFAGAGALAAAVQSVAA